METTKNIDQDVETLHGELDRHDGKRRFRCDRRCKYIVGGILLLALMFIFGILTRPAPVKVVVSEVPAQLDPQAPRVLQPEIGKRLSVLHQASKKAGASLPTLASDATAPRIISWTPAAVGKQNSDGSVVPVTGTYEIPAGWYGAVRLLSDGEEIGAALLDSRSLSTSAQGHFSIIPESIEGDHLVRLSLDAVKSCRITCASDDQLCIATNVNYCQPQFDNQTFLSYLPTAASAQPPIGSCVTKTFSAGPKYPPQIPEDYMMCGKGMWNTNIAPQALTWLLQNHASEVSDEDTTAFLSSIVQVLGGGGLSQLSAEGRSGDLSWKVSQNKGDAGTQNICSATLKVSLHCADGIKETPKSEALGEIPHKLSFLEKVKEIVIAKTAYASGACTAIVTMSGKSIPVSKDVPISGATMDSAGCTLWANAEAASMIDTDWNAYVKAGTISYTQGPAANGACGPADGGVSATMPGQRCASNYGSTVGPNTATQWNWTCNGDNGGTNASCSSSVIPSTAPTSPVGNWFRYQGSDCDSLVSPTPRPGWIGACPFGFFAEPSGQWGIACDNSTYEAMYGAWGGTWNCQVSVPPGYGSGYGCNPPGWLGGGVYHNYSCNGSAPISAGVCGSGAGVSTAVEPTGAGACATGPLISNVPPDTAATWKWTCNGLNGGTPIICTAPKSAAPPPPVPDLTISPDPVVFGFVPTGSTGSTQTFTVTNIGSADFSGSITFPSNGAHEAYSCLGGLALSVPSGGSQSKTCTLTTTIVASLGGPALISGGAYSKNFTVTATADARTNIEITPVSGSPIVSPYAFPPLSVPQGGAPVTYDFEVRNIGSSVMNYTTTIGGASASSFTITHVSPAPAGTPCSGALSSGQVHVCRVTFTPSSAGPISASINFDNQSPPVLGADPAVVQFSGSVTTNPVCNVYSSAAPPVTPVAGGFEYDFGAQNIGTPITRTIYIANTGTGNLSGTLSGPTGVPFSVSPSSGPVNIPASGNTPVSVTFNPQTTAAVTGTITITGTNAQNFPGGTVTITVKGSGIAVPALKVTPQAQIPTNWNTSSGNTTNMTFGLQEVYLGPVETKTVTIDNTAGSAPSTVTISSSNPEFAVSTNSLVVPNGTTRTFTITFDPSAPVPPVARSGIITLDADNLAPNFTINVQGTAEVAAPAITVTPTPLTFNKVLVGKTKEMTVTIRSTDARTIDFGAVGAVLGNPVYTCVSGNCFAPFQMVSGDVQIFTVRFSPPTIGNYAGTMIIPITTASIPALPPIPISGTGARPSIKYEEN